MTFLLWLSQTAPVVWARESDSVWGYPTILFLHTFGLSLLVGFTAALDCRVLGFAEHLPLAPLERFFRFIWIGFWINAISGVALLIMTPTKLFNPAFAWKMAFIGLGVVNTLYLRRLAFRNPSSTIGVTATAKALAATSLVVWGGAITAGRLMAYVGGFR
ncbi:MAG: hypothetical protein C5B57_02335 [Blastocatellia bacterium]|nr:MAG: hypothetical protein C5B57_02335 [Blastocatellia bacterium]